MPGQAKSGWTLLSADNPIINKGIFLKRVHVTATAASAECDLYHGITPQGKLIHKIRLANFGQPTLEYNIPLPQGLYVDLYTKVRHVLVIWEPLEE